MEDVSVLGADIEEPSGADNGGHWKGLDDLEIATCAWVPRFNEERLHGELGYLTPSEIEEGYRVKNQTREA